MTELASSPQNWEALLDLELRAGSDRTKLVPLRRYGPLAVQRPFYPEQECCHVYLLHPPGGVVGGDKIDLRLNIKAGAKALITTPGANKFYRSAADIAGVQQQFSVAAGSCLEFLPQENIYFPGAEVRSKTSIRVQPGGSVMLWEKHCFGRPANEEFFAEGLVISEIELLLEEKLIFTEKQSVDAEELRRSSGFRNYPVSGSFLIYGPTLEDKTIENLRQLIPQDGLSGITRLQPELTIARYLGNSTADMDRYFVKLWELLRPLIMQREACHPRIWKT